VLKNSKVSNMFWEMLSKNSETHGAVMTIAKILSNVIVLAGHF
jgi:hypothetical protein